MIQVKFKKIKYETTIKNKIVIINLKVMTNYIWIITHLIWLLKILNSLFYKFLSLVHHKLEHDIKEYLFKKFFSNINKLILMNLLFMNS